MPLSEHEQRMLEQMERALYAEDPKFASALRGSDLRGRYRRRAFLGIFGIVVGLALLPVGIGSKLPLVSVAGFLIMLGSAIWAITNWRRVPLAGESAGPAAAAPAARGRKAKAPKVGYMDRLEERWRRRREEDGR